MSIVFLSFAVACASTKEKVDITLPVDVPEAYAEESGTSNIPDRWWVAFDDPGLNRLVQRVLMENLSLKSAWYTMKQARANTKSTGSSRLPQIDVGGSVTRTRARSTSSSSSGRASSPINYSNTFQTALTPSWEIDLWNRIGSSVTAAEFEADASNEEVAALAISLTSQAGELWYTISEINAQIALLEDQKRVSESYLDLVRLRFGHGLASSVDLYQQKQQRASVEVQLPLLEMKLKTTRNELAVLLAKTPAEFSKTTQSILPELPPMPKTGLPAQLLERRPDVRAALYNALASEYSLAASKAQRLPSVTISGSFGVSGRSTTNLFDEWVGSLISGLTAPIFDGGRISADIEKSEFVRLQQINNYGEAVLVAFQEVEDALARENSQNEYITKVDERLQIADGNLRSARERYFAGQSDYLPVLNALQTLQQLQSTRLAAQRDLILYRIQLYKALGGSWSHELERESA